MSEFKTIETQEQFDNLISERLERQKTSLDNHYAEKYKDYEDIKSENIGLKNQLSAIQSKQTEDAEKLKSLTVKVQEYETNSVKMRIARETGLPYELAERLTGNDEEAIKKDAEILSKIVSINNNYKNVPLKDTEEPVEDDTRVALKKMLSSIEGE